MTEEELRRAYHEAGHAVAAHILGRASGLVTIVPTERYGGLTFHGRGRRFSESDLRKLGKPLPLLPAALRRKVEVEAVLSVWPLAELLVWPD
jgi:hypothetical protein